MTPRPPPPSPDPKQDLESHWLPKFEASASLDTDAARNIGHSVGHRERIRVFEEVVGAYPLPAGSVVLDVGCGSGTYFDLYASRQWQIRGIDFSPAQIEFARGRHPDAQLFAGRVEEAPPEFMADLVVCIGVTQAVTELDSFLRALARRILPGGMAIVSCLNARSLWPGSLLDPQLRFFSLSEMSDRLHRDFEILEVRRFYPLPVGYSFLRPVFYRLQVPVMNHGFMFALSPR